MADLGGTFFLKDHQKKTRAEEPLRRDGDDLVVVVLLLLKLTVVVVLHRLSRPGRRPCAINAAAATAW